ncbi:hypothetical protein PFISCL1PPCAC_18843 [Pristionchus fissidentatus]|uniref:tRNA (cytosine(34)-C(5))-methyltransferase n=1 Tax=Pristionchus fissidentatus TaxID=1538716 RepID=A0AAV5W9P8_9BILA|nr:hypothetical protein PFISCL1PPCAC_18843 [Pristionchus fissidentatus]
MGKFKSKKNFKNRSKSNGQWTQDRVVGVLKSNEKFFDFYKKQGLVPEEEWEQFVETLKKDLPVSFRIQGCHKDREILCKELEERYIAPIAASGDAGALEPKPLAWYSGAYQTPMSRSEVRAHPTLAALHNFLVTEAELGNVSRQEAVSMIPPLLLKPEAHHHVLDVCAAPGSKTMQLIEMQHETDPNPSGFIIANDVDKKRSYLLCHQVLKRMKSANCVVICEDGALMPNMRMKDDAALRFDRVLCDVICSGDGTMRKNPDIWPKWTPQEGLGLHKLQLSIARKSVQQLKVGGLMVYSTCSMNPMEDEAVVAQLLREGKGSLRLVDAHPRLPGLKASRGVSTWKVFDREMAEYATFADVPKEGPLVRALTESMWPPTEEEAKEMNLQNVMRLLPHQQDTGGFFVALIERVAEDKEEEERRRVEARAPAYKRQKMFKDEPFTFLKKDDERWDDLKSYYGIDESFPYENLFNRLIEGDNARQLFFVNESVKEFILNNMKTLSIQNAGMKMFGRNENKVEKVRYRISQEGVDTLHKYMSKQKMQIPKEDMLILLRAAGKQDDKGQKALVDMEKFEAKEGLRSLKSGSVVLYVDETRPICAWIGQRTAAPYIGKEERIHHLRLLGEDVDSMEAIEKTKRKQKAMEAREAAWAEKAKEEEKAAVKKEGVDVEVEGGDEGEGQQQVKRMKLDESADEELKAEDEN